jgi:hypothetical protein
MACGVAAKAAATACCAVALKHNISVGYTSKAGLGAQAHVTLVPLQVDETQSLVVLVGRILANDARGGSLNFNIYHERHYKVIAYLYLCISNEEDSDIGSVFISHTARM